MFPATKLAGLTKDVRERQSLTLQPQRSEKDDSDDSFHCRLCCSRIQNCPNLCQQNWTSCQSPKCAAGNGGMNIIIKNKIVS